MAEYINVEKPFLEKLRELNWQIIDHGAHGIPGDPAKSLRSNFREVTLKETFKDAVKGINKTPSGDTWLTDDQLEALYREVIAIEKQHITLLEANKAVFELLQTGTTVEENTLTGEKNPKVRFIDYKDWGNNDFVAINQFRIDTPHAARKQIIPDIVCFVNGLPFIVVECKDIDVSEPLSAAFDQVKRYSNLRDDDFGVKEGEERLFHYNMISILTHGEEARVGTISSEFEHYLNWKDIFPEEYKVIDIPRFNPKTDEKDPAVIQEIMIRGLLNKEILIDVLRHFTLFMEVKAGVEVKIICRYQQYRAVGKIMKRLLDGETAIERSGVVWHTQGSGKSLTMVFLVRCMRSHDELKAFKIMVVSDRNDLEEQLYNTMKLSGETIGVVSKRRELRSKLSNDSSDLHMVMMHKFLHEELKHSKALMKAYNEEGRVPKFEPFEKVNQSDKVLILIDEAHRTQGGDMGDNLFEAFPNGAKIAFTGTPLLTKRHKIKTHERFGDSDFIDTYKVKEAVRDGATLDIIYMGRTSKDSISDTDAFAQEFEDEFRERTTEEKEEIQKRYGSMQAYLENMDRLRKIANDIVNHYVDNILPNGFKAQVVASSIVAAARYENLIKQALNSRLNEEKLKAEPDEDIIKMLEFIDVCTVVTKQDNNEAGYISMAREKAHKMNAVENFKKDFDLEKPETGIAFLCVCDRLLTGFDAPIEQVMYLDKSLREHDLLQTIARVNRTKKDKTHGLIVDYYGVANHLKDALAIYATEDEAELKEFLENFKDINKEIPVLEARYNRLLQLFIDNGVIEIEDFVQQKIDDDTKEYNIAETIVELAGEVRIRAQFDTYLKAFFDSLDLLFNVSEAKQYWIPAKRFGYLLMRIRNRYKDATMDLKWAKPKVRKMIDKYLASEGIDSKVAPVSLFSDDFKKELDKNRTSKSKASEMEHAIRKHIKVEFDKDPGMYTRFTDRMNQILERYKGNWDMILEELTKLKDDIDEGRKKDKEDGLNNQEMPFYDIILLNAFKENEPTDAEKEITKNLVISIVEELQNTIDKPNFWKKKNLIRALESEIDDILEFSECDKIISSHQKITKEILTLAEKRQQDLTDNS